MTSLCFPYKIKSDPLCSVFHIHDPALPESEFMKSLLHGAVVSVGVNAEITALFQAE